MTVLNYAEMEKIALESLFHMIEEPIKSLTLGFQGQKTGFSN